MNNIIPLHAGESVDLGSFEIVKYENGIYEFAGLFRRYREIACCGCRQKRLKCLLY